MIHILNNQDSKNLFEQASNIASWMVFPHDSSRRGEFCAAIERLRFSNIRSEGNRSKPPQPFIWHSTAPNELTLIDNPLISGPNRRTPIDLAEDIEAVEFLGSMLDKEREFNSKYMEHFCDAYRKGFTAGCVLLSCYVFDSDLAPRHKSSKAKGESAAVGLTGMKSKSVQNFFREFNSVAHFWAAYHVSASGSFLAVSKEGIKEYTKKPIPIDFLDKVNFLKFLNIASHLERYGTLKSTTTTTLLDSSNIVSISLNATYNTNLPFRISKDIINIVLESYSPGKRETDLPRS